MLRKNPLNSSTLEYLLVDQVKFRIILFGGVVAFIIYQPSFILIYIYARGLFFDGTLSLLTHFVGNQPSFGIFLLQVTTCGFWCGSFASAGPDPPVMNGIFKVCHWIWASFLANPAGGLYIIFPVPLLPSCCWIGVLKVFPLHSYFSGSSDKIGFDVSSFFLKTFVWKIFLFLLTFRRAIALCKRIFQKKKISNQLL